jgi:2-dehydro-3-deoxyphosphogluconate aldolase / (4S)-4-hydroxy-2-oxoglutarate aldolase
MSTHNVNAAQQTALPLPAFAARVLPVIVITDVKQAVPLAHALLAGGVDVMEITLRSAAGVPCHKCMWVPAR